MLDKKEIYLEDLVPFLSKSLIKVDYEFFKKLLLNAANSNKPWRNRIFANKLNCPYLNDRNGSVTIRSWMKSYEKRAISFFYLKKIVELSSFNWKDVENNLMNIRMGRHGGKVYLKFPIKINKDLGCIIGHILGDGSIDIKYCAISYFNSNIELLKEFENAMYNIFKIKPRIWVHKKKRFEEKSEWLKRIYNLKEVPKGHNVGLFYPKVCGVILHSIFGEFAYGKNKEITTQILNQNLEFKKYLVKAFFDDDGSITSNNHTLRLFQDNKMLLENIRILIKEIGINSHEIKTYIKRDKLRYYFNINGFKEYYNFYHSIGCTSSSKKKEFLLLINKVKNSRGFKKKFAL